MRRQILVSIILLVFVTGCALPFRKPWDEQRSDISQIEKQLYEEVRSWKGTPYIHGGTGRDGIDCSGFVMRVYEKLFGIRLPRDASQQALIGVPVSESELRAGDLIFFSRFSKICHVGIYVRDGKFAHTSTSSGVTISHLENRYWQKSYRTSRRILHE